MTLIPYIICVLAACFVLALMIVELGHQPGGSINNSTLERAMQ